MRIRVRPFAVIAAAIASPAAAQETALRDVVVPRIQVRTELVAASGYLWRGITRHRTPVVQALASVGTGRVTNIALSAWASGITGDCDRPACPEGTGLRVADVNASLQASFPVSFLSFFGP